MFFYIIKSKLVEFLICDMTYCPLVLSAYVSIGVCVVITPLGDIASEIKGFTSLFAVATAIVIGVLAFVVVVGLVAVTVVVIVVVNRFPSFCANKRFGLFTLLLGKCS